MCNIFTHKYGKWIQLEVRMKRYNILEDREIPFIQRIERRHCLKCNKEQTRKIK